MPKFATAIVLLPVLLFSSITQNSPSAISDGQAPFIELKTIEEVNLVFANNKHRLLLSYDPVTCIHCYGYAKKLLNGLSNLDFIKENHIKLGLVNTRDFKGEKFDSDRSYASGLVYARKSNVWFFDEFTELVEKGRPYKSYHEKLLTKTVEFINQFVKPLKEISDFEMLDEELDKHGVIGIYLGSHNQTTFDRFKDFAISNSYFPFYYNRDENRNYDILAHFGSNPKESISDGFAIVKHPRNMTEFDKHKVSLLTDIYSTDDLRGFFTLNRFPKLVTDISKSRLIEAIHGSKLGVLVQVTDDSEESIQEQEAFKEVVRKIPRSLLFAQLKKADPILDEGLLSPLKEKRGVIFIVEIGKGENARAIGYLMDAEVTVDNLEKFIIRSLALQIISQHLSISNLVKSVKETPAVTTNSDEAEIEATEDKPDDNVETSNGDDELLLEPGPDRLEELGLNSAGWTKALIFLVLITVFFN